MDANLRSEIFGTLGLTPACAIALLLALFRRPSTSVALRRRVLPIFVVTLLFQTFHIAEEFATHFYSRFPLTFGLVPWPLSFFLAVNMSWLAIWSAAIFGLQVGARLAFFAAWFLALTAVANGIGHPLLSFEVRGYFPGLITSPLLGIAGAFLCVRLVAGTDRQWMPVAAPANALNENTHTKNSTKVMSQFEQRPRLP